SRLAEQRFQPGCSPQCARAADRGRSRQRMKENRGEIEVPVPFLELGHLDDLWFQVGGTLCNLQCRHCFISCHPHNRNFGFLNLEKVRRALDESVPLGVKEYYFTGGEPFLNPDIVPILELTL